MADFKDKTFKENNGRLYEKVSAVESEIDEYCRTMPVTEETECGIWFLKGSLLQRMANKKVLVLLFGFSTTIFGATFSYFNATISTMEKVFKIPTRTIGIISAGNDIVKLLGSVLFNYYATKGHQPRWVAFGLFCTAISCLLNAVPHFIYGPGDDLLQWNDQVHYLSNSTNSRPIDKQLCGLKDDDNCNGSDSNMFAIAYLFVSQMFQGVGGIAVYSMGFAYLDDNVQKKKSPIFMSLMFFMRLLGPTIGYSLASICLKLYIRLDLSPNIKNDDPRWLGAWWLGWIILAILLAISSLIMAMFPKSLPRAAARKELLRQKSNKSNRKAPVITFKDLIQSLKRLFKNAIYMINIASSIFYIFGYLPFWTFLQKYMENMYRVSAADASIYSGTFGLALAAIGILLGGMLVQKFKPNSKIMAFCNALATIAATFGVVGYMLTGCPDVDNMMSNFSSEPLNCNADCMCDFVRYSHICSTDGTQAFISPCHAGCSQSQILEDKTMLYTNCSCITSKAADGSVSFGSATPGPCAVNCRSQLIAFIAIVCFVKLIGGLSRITNFLVSLRCVEERDKPISLGLSLGIMSLMTFIPAPIVYGQIIDSACLVWTKTCSGTGNCWLLNPSLMRNRIVYTSLTFMIICSVLDLVIWRKMTDLNVFSDTERTEDEVDKKNPENGKTMIELVKK